jgi:hypothetical protein
MSWQEELVPSSQTDLKLRMAATLVLFLWNVSYGSNLETAYPAILVEFYALPLTRLFLLSLVLLSAYWCPTVGILAAFAYSSLAADVLTATQKY